jgi:hypothetical protein
MRPPRRISEILKRKELFLDEVRAKLENTALRLQVKLFEDIISEIIPQLEVTNGILNDSAHNYRLISQLDKIYDTFNVKIAATILPQINAGITTIQNFGTEYFGLVIAGLPARFDKIIEGAKVITDLKIGLRASKMIRGGVLMDALKIDPLEFKQLLSKAVTSQMSTKEFINIIKDNVNGTDIKSGLLDRQLKGFVYDVYQQYDRSYNKKAAEEFGMRYFVYQGGIIKDSRDFCVCHNDKVFSVEESELWKTWKPSDCDNYPAGWPKAKNVDEVPSYLRIVGYSPLDDAGGPRCRHGLAFIPDELAYKLRPDLKVV